MPKSFEISIKQNQYGVNWPCEECNAKNKDQKRTGFNESIKAGDYYFCLSFKKCELVSGNFLLCLDCADELYPEFKAKMDPNLRFYD